MPSPKDIPGFYYDHEKNRYFPLKGRIPGLKRPTCSSNSGETSDKNKKHRINKARDRERMKPLELLQFRELLGTTIMSNRRRYNFKQEYEKFQASRPEVWKYQRTYQVADSALEQMRSTLQTANGLKETCILLAGSLTGSVSLYEVGNIGHCFRSGSRCTPEHAWPDGPEREPRDNSSLGSIWSAPEASTSFSSNISCIRRIGTHCPDQTDATSSFPSALVTTLGSGVSGGSVYMVNLTEPLDFRSSSFNLHRRTSKIHTFDCTVWTADCSLNGTHAVVGTNLGVALINLETRASSWVYHSKSDVFSQQFSDSGNVVLCGLRNGAIIEVDVRERQSRSSDVSSRHSTTPIVQRTNPSSPVRHDKRSRQRFETKRTSTSYNHPLMPSAVCSLVALQSDENYYLGSSMDGSIKLFDRRLLRRGAIQSYDGHVNSHSHLQLGVNPSEMLVLSGGEDRYVRIWSIRSGELIFEENISNSILATVCWPQGVRGLGLDHSWGAWLGSHEGLYYMHGT